MRAARHGVTRDDLAVSQRRAGIFVTGSWWGVHQMSERSSNFWLSELKQKVPVGS